MLFSGKVIEPKLNKLAKKNDCIEIYIPIYCRINIVFLAMYISNCGYSKGYAGNRSHIYILLRH
jgi:hypothetical protein